MKKLRSKPSQQFISHISQFCSVCGPECLYFCWCSDLQKSHLHVWRSSQVCANWGPVCKRLSPGGRKLETVCRMIFLRSSLAIKNSSGIWFSPLTRQSSWPRTVFAHGTMLSLPVSSCRDVHLGGAPTLPSPTFPPGACQLIFKVARSVRVFCDKF